MTGRLLMLILLLAACAGTQRSDQRGPLLVSESTLVPTVMQLAPPTATVTPSRVPPQTPEVPNPVQQITVEADFVLVTPTLPPSKTPTRTPTNTVTPSYTPSPTQTVTATATTFLLPTSEIIPITREVAAPVNRVCTTTFFFDGPRPDGCPLAPPNASNTTWQQFQNGYMVWVGSQDAIYVLYNDSRQPRWQVFRDYFEFGNPSMAPLIEFPPEVGPGLWQPRQGFGLLWQNNPAVRERIGAALTPLEPEDLSARIQTSSDGSVFIGISTGELFVLAPDNVNWRLTEMVNGQMPRASGGTMVPTSSISQPPPLVTSIGAGN